ncbi:MAG: cupin domain-containing protein [Nibricoccus sp.]
MNPSCAKNQTADITVIAPEAGESWWVATSHQFMKLTAANTRGAVSLWFETVPPGGGPPPHVHFAEDEVFVVTEGEITFQSGDRSWLAQKSAVVFAPRGLPHTFRNSGKTPARMIVFVTPGGFDGFFRETAFRWSNPETRPPLEPVEIDRLFQAAPKYDLEFRIPEPENQATVCNKNHSQP